MIWYEELFNVWWCQIIKGFGGEVFNRMPSEKALFYLQMIWPWFLMFDYPESHYLSQTRLCIVNIHISCAGACSLRFPSTIVDIAQSYSCSLAHANSSALSCLSYLPIFPSLPPSLALCSFLSPSPSFADPLIHGWYIGGHPVCHAWLWAAFRSLSLP